jgi:hypothetical protein
MSTPTKEAQDGAGERHEDELDEQTEVDGGKQSRLLIVLCFVPVDEL